MFYNLDHSGHFALSASQSSQTNVLRLHEVQKRVDVTISLCSSHHLFQVFGISQGIVTLGQPDAIVPDQGDKSLLLAEEAVEDVHGVAEPSNESPDVAEVGHIVALEAVDQDRRVEPVSVVGHQVQSLADPPLHVFEPLQKTGQAFTGLNNIPNPLSVLIQTLIGLGDPVHLGGIM